jgi:hypothetical protein
MPSLKEQIRKLPPEMRIKALRQVQDKIKKLIEARQKEIVDAQSMLEEAEDELKVLEEIQAPQQKPVRIEELFRAKEEPEEDASLERIAERQAPKKEEIERLAREPIKDLAGRVNYIKNRIYDTGLETEEQRNEIYTLEKAFAEKRKDIEHGNYKPGEKEWGQMTESERSLAYLRHTEGGGMYKS